MKSQHQFPGRLLLSYGHSWVDGDGASGAGSGFAALTARALGLTLDNRAVGGSSSSATAELLNSDPPVPASMYLIMTGLNDLRLHGDAPAAASGYASALQRTLTVLRRTAPHSTVIAVAQPHLLDFSRHPPHNRGSNALIDEYNSILRRTAAQYSFAVLAEAFDWDRYRMLDEDTVHPNDAGHACLAAAVTLAAELRPPSEPVKARSAGR